MKHLSTKAAAEGGGYFLTPVVILEKLKASLPAKIALCYIISWGQKTGEAAIPNSKLAKMMGISPREINYIKNELLQLGVVKIISNPEKREASKYQLHPDRINELLGVELFQEESEKQVTATYPQPEGKGNGKKSSQKSTPGGDPDLQRRLERQEMYERKYEMSISK